jgi:hypothetical protein
MTNTSTQPTDEDPGKDSDHTGPRKTRAEEYVDQFQALTQAANDAGLLGRRYGFYWVMILTAVLAVVAIMVGMVYLGDTWYRLILAALLAWYWPSSASWATKRRTSKSSTHPSGTNGWDGSWLDCVPVSATAGGWTNTTVTTPTRTRRGLIQTSLPASSSSPRKQAIAAPAGRRPSPNAKASTSSPCCSSRAGPCTSPRSRPSRPSQR